MHHVENGQLEDTVESMEQNIFWKESALIASKRILRILHIIIEVKVRLLIIHRTETQETKEQL